MLKTLAQSFLTDEADHITDEAQRGSEQALSDPYRPMQSQLGCPCYVLLHQGHVRAWCRDTPVAVGDVSQIKSGL